MYSSIVVGNISVWRHKLKKCKLHGLRSVLGTIQSLFLFTWRELTVKGDRLYGYICLDFLKTGIMSLEVQMVFMRATLRNQW